MHKQMGVSFNKRVGAWQAYKGHKAKRVHLGYYLLEEDAKLSSEMGKPLPERQKGSSKLDDPYRRGRRFLSDSLNMNGGGI